MSATQRRVEVYTPDEWAKYPKAKPLAFPVAMGPISAAFVDFVVRTLYPGLPPFALSLVDAQGGFLPLDLDSEDVPLFVILHSPGDTSTAPALPRAKLPNGRMSKHGGGKRSLPVGYTPRRGSKKPSSASPASTASTRGSPSRAGLADEPSPPAIDPEALAEALLDAEPELAPTTLQAQMASNCLRRDQFCVVSGSLVGLECAHILRPEYAFSFFEDRRAAQWLEEPQVIANKRPYDTYFPGHFWIRDGVPHTFVFNEQAAVLVPHNHPLAMPLPNPRCSIPDVFLRQFPHNDLLLVHLQEAVLRQCRGAGERDEEWDDEEGGWAVMEEEEEEDWAEEMGMASGVILKMPRRRDSAD
ncbi:uncharacterized protein EV422DRAFT_503462 [Fimicolochytrium jonesii]|uniref:uncharacterized protein n=1 Tax=Fimicolochytrium jonesii TaxID=1396493 RepID=UPI0022FE3756|nr:uncharacterized protein EV422DRAFT_503462 [Fimicolochytrium jonesii]KAI8826147.1 hypothetical protein EV422DRAFT_503462 [Fimicolochytrium jonesii]